MLITVDDNGNMVGKTVTPPSLSPITTNDKVIYLTSTNDIALTNISEIYTSYPDHLKNLLACDVSGIFSVVSSQLFNPCHINTKDTSGTGIGSMNGIPQSDGTCRCTNYWSGNTPGHLCGVCDGTDYEITHRIMNSVDNTTENHGVYAGKNCELSRVTHCNNHGDISDMGGGIKRCSCDPTYNGPSCEYSNQHECNNNGLVENNGTCTCSYYTSNADRISKQWLGDHCQYSDTTTCGNGNIVDSVGKCYYTLQDGDIIRITTGSRYLTGGQYGCSGIYAESLSFAGAPNANSEFKFIASSLTLPGAFVGTLMFSNTSLSSSYNTKYVSIQKPSEQVTNCNPNFENVIHRVLHVSSNNDPIYSELIIKQTQQNSGGDSVFTPLEI
jgi:hypothetical protein